ncbi:collagen-like protein [Mesonia sp. K4-1]|uniref:collagen-like protein n=1 Tax=Mesonia sp. K4-1 TaxID=2602760 RepID=UPI0011C92B3F|nr:collagen-like protein [Mesonia sp. K4-1]TXK75016.1 collagen-like protein [Mesonia sp. K4-1]
MKKLLLGIVIAAGLMACEGDRGPQGPPGQDGLTIIGQTYEYENVNFTYEPAANLYSRLLEVPSEIEVLESDAILVYRLEVVSGDNGPIETWSLIPQNFFLPQGTMQYVYNHTAADVELLIDGNFDLSTLDAGFTTNQVFRFVVVPSDFAKDPKINIETYDELEKAVLQQDFQLKEFAVQ